MIADKKSLREYLEKDRYALGIRRKRHGLWGPGWKERKIEGIMRTGSK